MKVEEYLSYDAIGLARLVASGEVSASEVLDAALARMAQVNPRINAVTVDLSAQARKRATQVSGGPLAGVPYLIKEHAALVAGTATMLGSAVLGRTFSPPTVHWSVHCAKCRRPHLRQDQCPRAEQ